MKIIIKGTPKEIAELALELQTRQPMTEQDFILTVDDCSLKSEKILIDRIKELLLKYGELSKEKFSEFLQERDSIIKRDCAFFYKYNAEKLIDIISKSLIREIWNI